MPTRFDTLALSAPLLTVVAELGYAEPTPVQAESIPLLLEGRDLVGQSRTGSGKTAAFVLPLLERVELGPGVLQAVILCPTRELCAQVVREVRTLGRRLPGLKVVSVTGGQPLRPQAESLARGAHIAVGTPGRVLDHLRRGTLVLTSVQTVVLDEADRMLDMGFQVEMDEVLAALPVARQTVLFSATFSDSIEALSRTHQRDAVRVTIAQDAGAHQHEDGVRGEALAAGRQTRACWLAVEPDERLAALYWALDHHPHESALVFCNFKASVAELTAELRAAGIAADCLHGDLDQFDRDQVLAMFRNQSVRVLVATDVAARGIDIEKLDLVVCYELPAQPEIYVHRIGRTGRAGRRGVAISLATPREDKKLASIEALTGGAVPEARWHHGDDAETKARVKRLCRAPRMDTIRISGGRKDKVRPGDILGALTGEAGGLEGSDVGKIEIHPKISYVAVARERSRHAAACLDQGRIKKRRYRATLLGGPTSPSRRERR